MFSNREAGSAAPPVEAKTLYIGGGTPSTLGPGQLARLISGVTAALGRPEEITCEANPESATAKFLAEAGEAGVTRLSIGVQSLFPRLCTVIGRRPTHVKELERIRSEWQGVLAADLIIGIPGQTTDDLMADVTQLVEMGFSHLSIYDLSVESDTPLARRVASGRVVIPEDGPDWPAVCTTLARFGFVRYEVSNFALPGHESQHNLGYWRSEPYVGLGPSAVSTLPVGDGARRLVQTTDHARFLCTHPFHDAEVEVLDGATLLTEFLMLGLRIPEGVSLRRFRSKFGGELAEFFGRCLTDLEKHGMLVLDEHALRPTARGMDMLNGTLVDLLSNATRGAPG